MSKISSLMKKVPQIFLVLALLLPILASAATFGQVLDMISVTILSPLIGLLLTAAVVVFFYGMVKYIYSLGEKEKVEGRWLMVWGVIALFVMVSVWGLVGALKDTIGLTDADNLPTKSIVIP